MAVERPIVGERHVRHAVRRRQPHAVPTCRELDLELQLVAGVRRKEILPGGSPACAVCTLAVRVKVSSFGVRVEHTIRLCKAELTRGPHLHFEAFRVGPGVARAPFVVDTREPLIREHVLGLASCVTSAPINGGVPIQTLIFFDIRRCLEPRAAQISEACVRADRVAVHSTIEGVHVVREAADGIGPVNERVSPHVGASQKVYRKDSRARASGGHQQPRHCHHHG